MGAMARLERGEGRIEKRLPSFAAELVAFSATTRMSGVDLPGRSFRKGAADAVRRWVHEQGGAVARGTLDHVAVRRVHP